MLTLRPYQQTAIENILADWQSGYRTTLLMAATGTGKTVIFLALLERIMQANPGARALVIAHRRELIYQPVERAGQFMPALAGRMGVVMADADDVRSQVIVATIQSLVAGDRLERILQHGPIDYVIIDEAHHAPAGTYQRVIEALGNPFVLGCTATPKRTDKIPLRDVFQRVSYRISIQDAIKQGALVGFTPLGFSLPTDASAVKETPDGWAEEPMGDLLSADNILEIVLAKWREFSADRQTIGFTASVAQAHATAAYFTAGGINAAAVDGTTPKPERDRILRQYQAGEIQIVFNCMVLTEGFDAPETSCVMMIAPTRSDLVYVQRLGRGLRPAENKTDCVVLDFAPVGLRDVVMAGDVLDGVPKKIKQATSAADQQGILFGYKVDGAGIQAVDPHEIQAVVLDYLTHHRLAWAFDGGFAAAALSDSAMLAILPPEYGRLDKADELRRSGQWSRTSEKLSEWIGAYRLYRIDKKTLDADSGRYVWDAECLGAWKSMTTAKQHAEELSREEADNSLSSKGAGWRQKPMSDAQAKYLRRLGAYQAGLTSDQAARRITFVLAQRSVQSAEHRKQSRIMAGESGARGAR